MSYHAFKDEDGKEYGSFETFKILPGDPDWSADIEPGWYWRACYPGCLPDGENVGPFETEAAARADALDEEYPLALKD